MKTPFRLKAQPTFLLTVPMHLPGQEAGAELQLTARHKTRKELRAWRDGAEGRTDAEFLLDVIVGWPPTVVDDDGTPVPFSAQAFEQLLENWPSAAQRIYRRYIDELASAPEKN